MILPSRGFSSVVIVILVVVSMWWRMRLYDPQTELTELFKNSNVMLNEVASLMKKAVFVREDILHQAIQVFKKNKVEVYCAPYEADFQIFSLLSGLLHHSQMVLSMLILICSFLDQK